MSAKSKKNKPAWAPVANPELAAGMRDIRSSNKAGTHADTRFRRARTKQAVMHRILKEN